MFDDLKQTLQRVLTATADRILITCNRNAARGCKGCLINQVLEMSAVRFYTICFTYICNAFNILSW